MSCGKLDGGMHLPRQPCVDFVVTAASQARRGIYIQLEPRERIEGDFIIKLGIGVIHDPFSLDSQSVNIGSARGAD